MKSDALSLFTLATDILTPFADRVTRQEEEMVDKDTMRLDVTDEETDKWIMCALVHPESKVIKEILFPTLRLN